MEGKAHYLVVACDNCNYLLNIVIVAFSGWVSILILEKGVFCVKKNCVTCAGIGLTLTLSY